MVEADRVKSAKTLGNKMIQCEIDRCRRVMGEVEWEKHGEWVTDNIVTAAKDWLARELAEGRL